MTTLFSLLAYIFTIPGDGDNRRKGFEFFECEGSSVVNHRILKQEKTDASTTQKNVAPLLRL